MTTIVSAGLQDLPTECIVEICKHLDFSSLISFRATARFISHIITAFERALTEHWVSRDVFAYTHAQHALATDLLSNISSSKIPSFPSDFAFYALIMLRQRVALDVLNLLLSEMGINQPRSLGSNLVRMYTLWDLLTTWQHRFATLPNPTPADSTALQTEILQPLSDAELDGLIATMGATVGIVCQRLRVDYPRITECDRRRGWTILGLPLEELAFFVIADGFNSLHRFLFSEKCKIDWVRARKVVRDGSLRWFIVTPALDILEQRGYLDRQAKTERFMSVAAFVERKAGW